MNIIGATDPDRAWEEFGQEEPYFGVITSSKFHNSNLNDESIEEFFQSGETHVEHICHTLRSKVKPSFKLDRVLDYGCGVGRLVVPFSKRCQSVVGVDVSPAMLAHAQKNCERRSINHAQFVHAADLGSLAPGSFDLVHSYIVFQHIPIGRGERIFRDLIGLIAEGGVGAIHFTYAYDWRTLRRLLYEIRARSGIVHSLLNVLQGKRFSRPFMQMNIYSVNRILDILYGAGCLNLHVEFSCHFGWRGAMVYFEKTSVGPPVNPCMLSLN
jgi:SAM-dependent methyltransferase